MKNKYNIELFRCPDEAYIIEYNESTYTQKNNKKIPITRKKYEFKFNQIKNYKLA